MCYGCYVEYGEPKEVSPYVKQAAEAVRHLYSLDMGGVGGYGHIVFDDWNLDTECIESCLNDCKNKTMSEHYPEDVRVYSQIALTYFYYLTEEQRATALALCRNYIPQ